MRREEQLFVVEGVRMFCEAPVQWIREVYVSESFLRKAEQNVPDKNAPGIRDRLKKCHYEVFADDVFKKVSDTQTQAWYLQAAKTTRMRTRRLCRIRSKTL